MRSGPPPEAGPVRPQARESHRDERPVPLGPRDGAPRAQWGGDAGGPVHRAPLFQKLCAVCHQPPSGVWGAGTLRAAAPESDFVATRVFLSVSHLRFPPSVWRGFRLLLTQAFELGARTAPVRQRRWELASWEVKRGPLVSRWRTARSSRRPGSASRPLSLPAADRWTERTVCVSQDLRLQPPERERFWSLLPGVTWAGSRRPMCSVRLRGRPWALQAVSSS